MVKHTDRLEQEAPEVVSAKAVRSLIIDNARGEAEQYLMSVKKPVLRGEIVGIIDTSLNRFKNNPLKDRDKAEAVFEQRINEKYGSDPVNRIAAMEAYNVALDSIGLQKSRLDYAIKNESKGRQ